MFLDCAEGNGEALGLSLQQSLLTSHLLCGPSQLPPLPHRADQEAFSTWVVLGFSQTSSKSKKTILEL